MELGDDEKDGRREGNGGEREGRKVHWMKGERLREKRRIKRRRKRR